MKLLEQTLKFQLPVIQLEGMDQVRSNLKLHMMVIVKVVPVVIHPPEGEAVCESFFWQVWQSLGSSLEFVSSLQ